MLVVVLQDQGYIYSTYVAQDLATVKAILTTDVSLEEGQGECFYKAYMDDSVSEREKGKAQKHYNNNYYNDCPEISVEEVEQDKVLTLEDMFEKLL